jgi:hypothetical protein
MTRRTAGMALAATVGAVTIAAAVPAAAQPAPHKPVSKHVLLMSIDGLHQSDLDWYVRTHPHSALAALVNRGIDYTGARTPIPSDSFPGMVAQVTGGNPKTTGVYYDDTYNHALLPAGTTSCAGKPLGAEVDFTEDLDLDKTRIDAGQGLAGLPGSILAMTGKPQTLINPAKLPVDPKTCKPVYPHQYLKVNTVFNVVHNANLLTAWSDKHPAYEILNGPAGNGIDDQFSPEINSDAPGGGDWTTDNAATKQYDGYKVKAVLNEIDGKDHSGTKHVGVPAIFGMNFQTVSTAEKLPTSEGLTGGYLPGGTVPGPLLRGALDYVNHQVGTMVSELKVQHHDGDTTIILSAKHGQSPTDPNTLKRLDDGAVINGLNAAWTAHSGSATPLVAFAVDDDFLQFWLSNRGAAATAFARAYLLTHSASGTNYSGGPITVSASGLKAVYAGSAAAAFFGVGPADPRHADVVGVVKHGVVYTGGTSKIAEHGGTDPQDRDVPIVVAGPGIAAGQVGSSVETTQIAPTILRLLGLNPQALQAVRAEHTAVLPGI